MTETPTTQFEIVRHVTRPLLKTETGTEVFVTFEGPIYKADALSAGRDRKPADGAAPKEPPYLANVLDLVHGKRPSQMIINAVLKSELEKQYPDEKYVNKSFHIVRNQIQGKRYATFEVQEVRIKGEQAPAETTVTPKGKK